MSGNHHGKRQTGSTMAELLAVVGILTILLMIAFPAINKLAEISRRVKCAGNLRQIGILMQSYLADHRYEYPPGVYQASDEHGNTIGQAYGWAWYLTQYHGMKDFRCFICPAIHPEDVQPGLRKNLGVNGYVSYAVNRYGVCAGITAKHLSAFQTSIPEPSKVILALDYDAPNQPYIGWYRASRDDVNQNWDEFSKRHSGVVNVLYCDGHVKTGQNKEAVMGSDRRQYPWAEEQYIRLNQ